MKTRTIVVVLVAAAVLAGGAFVLAKRKAAATATASAAAAAASSAAPVEFLPTDLWTAQPVALMRALPLTGTLRAADQTTVKTRVAGDLVALLVREGETVKKGQVLARIDDTEYAWRVKQQQASLAAAQAQLEMATKTRANNEQLLAKGFISQNAFDNAQSGFDAAVGTRDAAAAALELARKSLADATIVAPMKGTIGERFAQPGEKLPVDGRIVSLVDLGSLELEAPIPADDIAQVTLGQRAEFALEGSNAPRSGKVARISPATTGGSRSVLVYVAIEKPDAALRAGMFAQGKLLLDKSEPSLAVPFTALREEAGANAVLAIVDGRIAKLPVTVGRRGNGADGGVDLVEIKSGLQPGARVLRQYDVRLAPGATASVGSLPSAAR